RAAAPARLRRLVEDRAAEFDPFDVAAAAVKLAHQASHDEEGARADEQDIPAPHLPERPDRGRGRARTSAPRGGATTRRARAPTSRTSPCRTCPSGLTAAGGGRATRADAGRA